MQQPVDKVSAVLAPVRAWLEDTSAKQKRWLIQAGSYIGKACILADKLNIAKAPQLPGNQAWSEAAMVPDSVVMSHILHDLPAHIAPSSCVNDRVRIDEVEAAIWDWTSPPLLVRQGCVMP